MLADNLHAKKGKRRGREGIIHHAFTFTVMTRNTLHPSLPPPTAPTHIPAPNLANSYLCYKFQVKCHLFYEDSFDFPWKLAVSFCVSTEFFLIYSFRIDWVLPWCQALLKVPEIQQRRKQLKFLHLSYLLNRRKGEQANIC